MTEKASGYGKRKQVKICTGRNCTRNFANDLLKKAKQRKDIDVATSCCMGMCDMAPSVMIEGKVHNNVNPRDFEDLLGAENRDMATLNRKVDSNGLESVADLLDV